MLVTDAMWHKLIHAKRWHVAVRMHVRAVKIDTVVMWVMNFERQTWRNSLVSFGGLQSGYRASIMMR